MQVEMYIIRKDKQFLTNDGTWSRFLSDTEFFAYKEDAEHSKREGSEVIEIILEVKD